MGSKPTGRHAPALTRHVGDVFRTFDELQDAAEVARSLVGHPGWSILRDLIEAEVSTIDTKLDGDRVLDSKAEYAHLHGRRGGLMAGPMLIEALIARAASRLEEQRLRHEGAGETVLEGV